MPRKALYEWKTIYPAQTIRCGNCGAPVRIRSYYTGRFRTTVLKGGRGWRNQGKPTKEEEVGEAETGSS